MLVGLPMLLLVGGYFGWRWYSINLAESPAYAALKVCASHIAMGRLRDAENCSADDASRRHIADVYNISQWRLEQKVITIEYRRESEITAKSGDMVYITAVQRVIFEQEGRSFYEVRLNATVVLVGAAWRIAGLTYDFLGFEKTGR